MEDCIFRELTHRFNWAWDRVFNINGTEYKNMNGSTDIEKKKKIIAGAHYDVASNQGGANDNASVAIGILELSRLFTKQELQTSIDFVAYCPEVPSFIGTKHMGSHIHAQSIQNEFSLFSPPCRKSIHL